MPMGFVLEENWLEGVFGAHHVRDEAANVHLVEASDRCNVATRAVVFCKVPAEATHGRLGWMSIEWVRLIAVCRPDDEKGSGCLADQRDDLSKIVRQGQAKACLQVLQCQSRGSRSSARPILGRESGDEGDRRDDCLDDGLKVDGQVVRAHGFGQSLCAVSTLSSIVVGLKVCGVQDEPTKVMPFMRAEYLHSSRALSGIAVAPVIRLSSSMIRSLASRTSLASRRHMQ